MRWVRITIIFGWDMVSGMWEKVMRWGLVMGAMHVWVDVCINLFMDAESPNARLTLWLALNVCSILLSLLYALISYDHMYAISPCALSKPSSQVAQGLRCDVNGFRRLLWEFWRSLGKRSWRRGKRGLG